MSPLRQCKQHAYPDFMPLARPGCGRDMDCKEGKIQFHQVLPHLEERQLSVLGENF